MITTLFENTQIYIGQTYAGNSQSNVFGECDFGEYNMALHVKDNPKQVLDNRSRLLNRLSDKCGVCQIAWVNQVHGRTVHKLNTLGKLQDADSLITHQKHTALAIMTADCVPIALFDKKVSDDSQIACVHAGTQGLASGVIANTVRDMTNPIAYIGACISQKNYQIPKSLAKQIVTNALDNCLLDKAPTNNNKTDMLDFYYKAFCQTQDDDKVLFDVGKMARLQLYHLGVEVINDTVACSYASDQFYSHRQATHQNLGTTGRMAMIITKKA